jgi:3-phosphoshikimate 1-carboxyvinyltransferase
LKALAPPSIQGDIRFVEAAEMMGAQIVSGPNWLEVSRGPGLAAQGD